MKTQEKKSNSRKNPFYGFCKTKISHLTRKELSIAFQFLSFKQKTGIKKDFKDLYINSIKIFKTQETLKEKTPEKLVFHLKNLSYMDLI